MGAARWYDFDGEELVTARHVTGAALADEVPSVQLAAAEWYARPTTGYLTEIANPKMDKLNADYEAAGGFTCPEARALVLDDAVVFDSGTVITADGRLVMDTFLPGGRHVINRVFQVDAQRSELPFAGRIPHVSGAHLLCKRVGCANYSHWLLEMFPRLPLCSDAMGAGFSALSPVLPAPGGAMGDIVAQSLDWVGMAGRGRATGHDHVARYERLVVPYGLSKHPFWLHPAAIRRIEAMTDPAPQAQRWLFVSRQDSEMRVLRNEDEVFGRLQAVFPQLERVVCTGLTLAEQRQLFAQARVVVAVMGGSFGNIVFAPRGGVVVCIGPGQFRDLFFRNLATQKAMRYLEVRGTPEGPGVHASFTLSRRSVRAVRRFLEQNT
jgi:capsular polysaccharide biosynthesis protein